MKKSFLLILAIAVLTICGCQVEEVRDNEEFSHHHFRIETTAPSLETEMPDTKTSVLPKLTLKWSDGDLISVINLSTGKTLSGNLSATVDGDEVTFEGDLGGSIKSGDKLAAVYPCQNYTTASDVSDFTFDLSSQNSTSVSDVQFCAYSLFSCKTTGVVTVESSFIIPVSFNQISISNIAPDSEINYIELSNVGNSLSFHVNKADASLDLIPSKGGVRISPASKRSGSDGSLFAYCALAASEASSRIITVKALPNLYTAEWAKSPMSTSKYYTSIAADFTSHEYKDFIVSKLSSLDVDYNGGTIEFNVFSNDVAWSVSTTPRLNVSQSTGTGCNNLTVSVEIPSSAGSSTSTYLIIFEGAGETYTFPVIQGANPAKAIIEIPDINLKKYMVANFDLDGDGEISGLEAEQIDEINCSNKGITDITGLKDCPNVTYINCSQNSIETIDLSNMSKLLKLSCYANPITEIILDNDVSLTGLYIENASNNSVSETSISINGFNQTEHIRFSTAGTKFTALAFIGSTTVKSIEFADNNKMESVDVHENTLLESLDVRQLPNLKVLKAYSCSLSELVVSSNMLLTTLECGKNHLTALNVSNNLNLFRLSCSDNEIPRLNLLNNSLISYLDVSKNVLENVNVSKLPLLSELRVSGNTNMGTLSVAHNPLLQTLIAENLSISEINLSGNERLKSLYLNDNVNLTNLDLSNNQLITNANVIRTNLSSLAVYDKNIIEKPGINITAKNGLSIVDSEGAAVLSSLYPCCIIGGILGVGVLAGYTYVCISAKPFGSATWDEAKSHWATANWTLGAGDSTVATYRSQLGDAITSIGYTNYLQKDTFYWSNTMDGSAYDQGLGSWHYTYNYYGSGSVRESHSKDTYSAPSFGIYRFK